MRSPIQAYPLQWPPGWRRLEAYQRDRAKFSKEQRQYSSDGSSFTTSRRITIIDGVERVIDELRRMGLDRNNIVISTNVPLRLDGLPRGDARAPADPGAAVYWHKGKQTRCMAIDRYDRVEDNLAAIAATLDAMRAIERHGGATILDRAFIGFAALPAPEQWFTLLGVSVSATKAEIEEAYRRKAMDAHPDRGGKSDDMARLNWARDEGLAVQ